MYNVLVTGSSGEIGTNLSLKLLELGHKVVGADQRDNTWTDKIPTTICNLADSADGIPEGKYDIVIHLAANAKVHELVQHPESALNNIKITFNVLEFCRKNSLPIIFSSSREVYGDIQRYMTNEEHSDFHFTESPYSASKIAGEALIYSFARCYDMPYIVFRFSNVYGRYDGDMDRMERVIPLFIQKMRRNEPITIFGRDKTLDFTYVDDCVMGIVSGMEKLLAGHVKNETINLAYGEGLTLIKMTELIADALGIKVTPNIRESRVGEVTYYIANIAKAKKLLGYSPKTNLASGIKKEVEWQKEYYKW
jgi:UDP-glucuronate 4-epimerase